MKKQDLEFRSERRPLQNELGPSFYQLNDVSNYFCHTNMNSKSFFRGKGPQLGEPLPNNNYNSNSVIRTVNGLNDDSNI